MKAFASKFILFLSLSLATSQSLWAVGFSYDSGRRCHQWKDSFVLNKANVNALLAIACTAFSHNENERKHMVYEDSATLFHQWHTVSRGNGIHAEGFCAIPYPNLKSGDIEKYRINLDLNNVTTKDGKISTVIKGQVVGRAVTLEFDHNEFLDDTCGGEVQFNKLQHIRLGMSGMPSIEDLMGILRSKRSGVILNLLRTEHWVQGNSSGYFSGLGVQYEMVQMNGRRIALAIAPSPSGSLLHVRAANSLYYHEGSDFFEFDYDTFGIPRGFANESQPTNSKYQSYSIEGGSQLIGCTSLIFESELALPDDLDMENCKRRVADSSLAQYAKRIYEKKLSQEEIEVIRLKTTEANLIRGLEDYIVSHYGPRKNYSSKPRVFETGHAHWKKEDVARGYVVYQRSIVFNHQAKQVDVVEFRYDASGASSRHAYKIPFSVVK